ncbi:ABC transporter permease [Kordiimonas laminariae]|uniref:ABC transporter permease n=1 Tax=Kordiimonas laminariae TaxID=2917717 RepID=UPI001FF42F2B|nr:FtsX-like permease family protein [Kordiimonas laminariae]MCK0068918.1 ABC transporter permease [Kordiimonas laminariae]
MNGVLTLLKWVFRIITAPVWVPFWILWKLGEVTGLNAVIEAIAMSTGFYVVYKNLTRKPLRLSLTMLAIFVAFTIYGTLTAFQNAFDAGVELSADDRLVSVNKINFTQPLPISYVNRVRPMEGVASVTHLNWFGGYYQDPQNVIVTFAVDEGSFFDVYGEDLVMSEEAKAAWLGNRQGLIVGESIARLNGWEVGQRIPLNSNIFSQQDGSSDWDFDIVGIYTGSDPQIDTNSIYFHYKYFNETQSFGGNFIGFMAIKTEDPDLNEAVIKQVDDLFANSPFETETVPEKVFNKGFIEQIGNIRLILSSVVLAAFFIILVIVGNSMVLAVRERTSEIGVLKTLGFTSPRIFRMVLGESFLLSIMSGSLGMLAAMGMIGVVNNAPIQLPTLIMTPDLAIEAFTYMALLGFITGIIPAVNALRLNIITALSRN